MPSKTPERPSDARNITAAELRARAARTADAEREWKLLVLAERLEDGRADAGVYAD